MQGAGEYHRALPRLHLLGPSARRGRGRRDARSVQEEGLFERAASSRRTGKMRRIRSRVCRTSSTSARSDSSSASSSSRARQADGARIRGVRARVPEGRADPHHRRHDRDVAAVHHREAADRPVFETVREILKTPLKQSDPWAQRAKDRASDIRLSCRYFRLLFFGLRLCVEGPEFCPRPPMKSSSPRCSTRPTRSRRCLRRGRRSARMARCLG